MQEIFIEIVKCEELLLLLNHHLLLGFTHLLLLVNLILRWDWLLELRHGIVVAITSLFASLYLFMSSIRVESYNPQVTIRI
jgi:hypothetical protein